jgi:hypothetical protein
MKKGKPDVERESVGSVILWAFQQNYRDRDRGRGSVSSLRVRNYIHPRNCISKADRLRLSWHKKAKRKSNQFFF